MGIIITCVVCWTAWKLFERWLFSDDNKKSSNATQSSKSESQEQCVLQALRDIEQAYKIVTAYPPASLKERINRTIYFINTTNEEITLDSEYMVSIPCRGKSSYLDAVAFTNDASTKAYYPGWTFSIDENGPFRGNEIFYENYSHAITWYQLKTRVISVLNQKHPEWKIIDFETYVSINF